MIFDLEAEVAGAFVRGVRSSIDGDIHTNELNDKLYKAARTAAELVAEDIGFDFDYDALFADAIQERVDGVLIELSITNRRVVAKAIGDAVDGGLSKEALTVKLKRVIGLDERYATAVDNFEERLISNGTPKAKVGKLTREYSDRLLTSRADAIAKTEVSFALNKAQQLAWEQAVSKGYLEGTEKRVWLTANGCCDVCTTYNGDKATLEGDFPNGYVHPPAHPHCRCTTALVYADRTDSLAKASGTKVGGGRKLQSYATHGLYGTSSSGLSSGATVRTPFGPVKRAPASSYEVNKSGETMADAQRKGLLDTKNTTYSKIINPSTGHRMHTSEVGDTAEHLLIILGSKKPVSQTFGTGLSSLVRTASDKHSALSRRGAIDVKSRTHAIEVKMLNARNADPNINLKPGDISSKTAAAKAMKKKPALAVMLFDDRIGTVSIYAHVGSFTRTITDSKTGKTKESGKFRQNQLQHVATYKVSKKDWDEAQKSAGWARNAEGRLTDIYGSVSKALRDHLETVQIAEPPHKPSRLRSKGTFGLGVTQEGADIEPGDTVISYTKEGVVIYLAGEEE